MATPISMQPNLLDITIKCSLQVKSLSSSAATQLSPLAQTSCQQFSLSLVAPVNGWSSLPLSKKKLVNSSSTGCFHVTFKWLNLMQLAR